MSARGRHPHCKLKDLAVRQARPGRHADGNGLYLVVRPAGTRSWVQRIVIRGYRRDLGLGAYPLVSLADARQTALENRRVARSGGDPVAVRVQKKAPTVRELVEEVIAARRVNWSTPGTEDEWRRLFGHFVFPSIGDKPVNHVTLSHVRAIVEPLWHGRGSRGYVLRQHLDRVFQFAVAHKHRPDNPAAEVTVLLTKVKSVVEHHPSLSHLKVRDAMAAVRASAADDAVKSLLLFLVLTAARVGEASGAAWSEIDLEGRVWVRPAARMKARRKHKVPLSEQALALLHRVRALGRPGSLVFVSGNGGRATPHVIHRVVSKFLRTLDLVDDEGRHVVTHGFRSTFRVWAMEVARAQFEVCEAALAHVQTDQTVAAYARSDLFEVRRELMQDWADYVLPTNGN